MEETKKGLVQFYDIITFSSVFTNKKTGVLLSPSTLNYQFNSTVLTAIIRFTNRLTHFDSSEPGFYKDRISSTMVLTHFSYLGIDRVIEVKFLKCTAVSFASVPVCT